MQTTNQTPLYWLIGLAIVLWPFVGPAESLAQGAGSLQGIVQQADKAIADQRIMLIRFGPEQEVQRTPGQTDAQGRFLFENLETGSQFTYFVGVRYKAQLHRSAPVTLLNEQRANIAVDLGETTQQETVGTSQQPVLYIANHLLVVIRRETHLEFREIVRLVNAGTTPYIASAPAGATSPVPVTFQLPLPQGAYNLSPVHGLPPEHIRTQASSIAYVAPLAPGEHRLIFSYNLPWRNVLTTILLERTLPTSSLDLLVEKNGLVATSSLQFGGQVTIDPHTFAHFRGVNLGQQMRSWVQLIPPSATSTRLLSLSAYSFIIGLALLGMLAPLRLLRDHRVTSPTQYTDHRAKDGAHAARDMAKRLVHDLAILESQRETGKIAEAAYQQQRQVGKAHLRHLVETFYLG